MLDQSKRTILRVHLQIYQMLLQHQAIEIIALFKEQHILISAILDKTLSPSQNFPIRRNLKRALTVNSCDPFPHPALQCT